MLTKAGQLYHDPLQYWRLVGKWNYLTHTRPDLSFEVHFLSQFMQQPPIPHWESAIHTLSYVQGYYDHGLMFNN